MTSCTVLHTKSMECTTYICIDIFLLPGRDVYHSSVVNQVHVFTMLGVHIYVGRESTSYCSPKLIACALYIERGC